MYNNNQKYSPNIYNNNNQAYPQNSNNNQAGLTNTYNNNQTYPQNTYNNNQAHNQMNFPYNQGNIYSPNNNIQNQNMMSKSQNTSPNMTNTSPITNQNMISLNANNMTHIVKPKITSLIRVLQCLYGCFEDIGPIISLKSMIKEYYKYKNNKYSLTLDILDNFSSSINPDNNFINSVYNLRNKINEQTNLFSKNEEITPNLIFSYIFKIINDEYINENIPYFINVFEGLKTIEKIPQSSLPQIIGKVNHFIQNNSPCYNIFYYLFLDIFKCPNCNNILDVNEKTLSTSNLFPLPGGMDGNISNLIKYYMKEKSENTNQNYICKCGKYEGHGKAEKALLNTPRYLLIDFKGQKEIQRSLDEKIDLTEYKLTDRGPNQYYLNAFILKYNEKYMAYVKDASSWVLYSDEITKTPLPFVSFDCIPYCAIYRGMQ